MSNSKRSGRQTPAQRAAAERRRAAGQPGQVIAAVKTGPDSFAAAPSSDGTEIFNLDAVAREVSGERFRFKVTDREGVEQFFDMFTPEEIDWRETSMLAERAIGEQDLRPVMQLLLGDEDYERFLTADVSQGQANALLRARAAWHGIKLPE